MASNEGLKDEVMYVLEGCFTMDDIEEFVGSRLEAIGFSDEVDKTIKSLNTQKSQLTRENKELERIIKSNRETLDKLETMVEARGTGAKEVDEDNDNDDDDDDDVQFIEQTYEPMLVDLSKTSDNSSENEKSPPKKLAQWKPGLGQGVSILKGTPSKTSQLSNILQSLNAPIQSDNIRKNKQDVEKEIEDTINRVVTRAATAATANTAPPTSSSNDDIMFTAVFKGGKQSTQQARMKPFPEPFKTMAVLAKKGNNIWARGNIVEIRFKQQIKVKFIGNGGVACVRMFSPKHIAYGEIHKEYLPVGTRTVAMYRDPEANPSYYAGIVAEPPSVRNSQRFLIFFDDGYAQYSFPGDVHKVFEQSRNVWEDIHLDSQDFIKEYLIAYPERPMVRLQHGQMVKTEWNGKWWMAMVSKVDASLVNMFFESDNRYEWIYRGSTRLEPLYTELANAEAAKTGGKAGRRHLNPIKKKKKIFVEYTREDESLKKLANVVTAPPPNSNTSKKPMARKSTASSKFQSITKKADSKGASVNPYGMQKKGSVSQDNEALGEIIDITPINQGRPAKLSFERHRCSSECLRDSDDDPSLHKGSNPLLIPMLCSWERQLAKMKAGTSKRAVFYRAPCGRRLRSLDEVERYLYQTDSLLTVDLFCFDMHLQTHREFVPVKTFCDIKDLSYGRENVPISCVNGIDRQYPEYMEYSSDKIPTEGVEVNLDPDFLVGCDCTDGCRDPKKCACLKLTMEASTATHSNKINPNSFYHHRSLDDQVITGIFECNKRCKCDQRCRNRVAQNGLTLRLQVFKTERKGWGLRCLDDIPEGGFICTYVGQLYTEEIAIQEGKEFGDEYQAELDFMEVVEKMKEGFESDVEDEGIGGEQSDDVNESDTDTASENSSFSGSFEEGAPVGSRMSARQKEKYKQKHEAKASKHEDPKTEEWVESHRLLNTQSGPGGTTESQSALGPGGHDDDSSKSSKDDCEQVSGDVINSQSAESLLADTYTPINSQSAESLYTPKKIGSDRKSSSSLDSLGEKKLTALQQNVFSKFSLRLKSDPEPEENTSNYTPVRIPRVGKRKQSASGSTGCISLSTDSSGDDDKQDVSLKDVQIKDESTNTNQGLPKPNKEDCEEDARPQQDFFNSLNLCQKSSENQSDTQKSSKVKNLPDPKSRGVVTPLRINLVTKTVIRKSQEESSEKKEHIPTKEKKEKRAIVPTRTFFGEDEMCYIMDAKTVGNIGRYLNHSCSPNVFVQNVFVDTHDLRFPWVAFFAQQYIRAGTELTWDYNYEVGSVPGKTLHCFCGSAECRGRLL